MECASFKCWKYRSRSYRSRGLGVEQREGVAVVCVWFKCWSYRSKSYRSRGLGVEKRGVGVAVECVIYIECLLEVLYLKSLFEIFV